MSLSKLFGSFSGCGTRSRPPDMVGRYEYIVSAVADRRKVVVFHFGSWAIYQNFSP